MKQSLIMLTRVPEGEEPEAEPVVVELAADGSATIALDDGEILAFDARGVDELRAALTP
jgi:hypothetical protein